MPSPSRSSSATTISRSAPSPTAGSPSSARAGCARGSRLDEAMAALTAGEVSDLAVAGKLLRAAHELRPGGRRRPRRRVVRVVNDLVLAPMGGRPKALQSHCLVVYGSVLAAAGRWSEAEEIILRLSARLVPALGHRIATTCHLARVRLEQGRVEEAAALLAPNEDQARPVNRSRTCISARETLRSPPRSPGAGCGSSSAMRCAALRCCACSSRPSSRSATSTPPPRPPPWPSSPARESACDRCRGGIGRAGCAMARGDLPAAVVELRDRHAALSGGGWPTLVGAARIELAETLAAPGERRRHRRGARRGRDLRAPRRRRPAATGPRPSSGASVRPHRPGRVKAATGRWRRSPPARPRCSSSSARAHQRRDRRPPVHLAEDGRAPREPGAGQARRAHPGRGGGARRRSADRPLTLAE